MVSKTWGAFFNHISAAIRGWKNHHRTDIPRHNSKRPTSHRYLPYTRRRATNDVIASLTIHDMQRVRSRYVCGTNKFIGENFFGMTDEQTIRALHCFNAHRSEIYKLYRHLVNEV